MSDQDVKETEAERLHRQANEAAGFNTTKHRTLLNLVDEGEGDEGEVLFRQQHDDDYRTILLFAVTTEAWKELGSPDVLTVSLEPGARRSYVFHRSSGMSRR